MPTINADDALTWISIAGAVLGALAWVRKKTRPQWLKLKQLLEDWTGVPDRPGVPGRPGVMERIDAIEHIAKEARYHSMPNGGNSAYDKLSAKIDRNHDQAARDTAEIRDDTATLISTLAEHSSGLERLESRMSASEADRANIHREISIVKFGGTEKSEHS